MNDEICECGHSINKHYLDNPSEGEPSGYCTHYYEEKHVFCNCRKSPGEIASVLRARAEEVEQERDAAVSDLQDAVDFVYKVYGESNETLAAITTGHWRVVIASAKGAK